MNKTGIGGTMVEINSSALAESIKKKGKVVCRMEDELGLPRATVGHAIKSGKMNSHYLTMVSLYIGAEPNSFVKKCEENVQKEESAKEETLKALEERMVSACKKLDLLIERADKTNEILAFINRNICELITLWEK